MDDRQLKILIVTHWFYPRQVPRAFRAHGLYKELIKNNCVDVVIGEWRTILYDGESYSQKLDKYSNKIDTKSTEIFSNSRFVQIVKAITEYFVGERYLITGGRFVKSAIRLDKYDAVISIGLPFYIHWLTANAIKAYKKRGGSIISISDWGDPFVGQTIKKIAPYFNKIQKRICDVFDYIVTPTEQAVDYYLQYTDRKKIQVVPQGIDFDEVKVESYVKGTIPRFAYAGIFYEGIRSPEPLLEYLSSLEKDFIFTIYTIKHGNIYQNIILKYEAIMGEKLVVHDMIPRLKCIRELSKNEFLINIENMTSTQIPSKLLDYSLTGRPILSFKQNEIPKQKFEAFLNGIYDGELKIDVTQFDIKNISDKFIKMIAGDV